MNNPHAFGVENHYLHSVTQVPCSNPPQCDFFKDTWLKKTYFCDKQTSIYFKKGYEKSYASEQIRTLSCGTVSHYRQGFFPEQLQYKTVIFLLFKPSWNTPYGSHVVSCEVPHEKLITLTSTAPTGVLRALLPVSITLFQSICRNSLEFKASQHNFFGIQLHIVCNTAKQISNFILDKHTSHSLKNRIEHA